MSKITCTNVPKATGPTFGELKSGDLFLWGKEEIPYCKLPKDILQPNYWGAAINPKGYIAHFDDNEEIIPINEMHIIIMS